MSTHGELPIGPNLCAECGGEYGEHAARCSFAASTGSAAECKRQYEAALRRYYEHGKSVDHDLMLQWFARWTAAHNLETGMPPNEKMSHCEPEAACGSHEKGSK